jgi:uncharacterized Ntn-hydrolase superfamily protein
LTYSIAACDLEAAQWGVATQSKFLAVGSVVPWAEAGAGAVATQAYANPRYGPDGLAMLRAGASAQDVVERLTAADEGSAERQLGVVDARGGAATFTGTGCSDWAGGRTGDGWAAQGNILVSGETVDALGAAFEAGAGRPLAVRLLEALVAAQAAGGGYGGLTDVLVDLRVDDDPTPVAELVRLHGIHEALFGRTPRESWVAVDTDELTARLSRLGYDGELDSAFRRWAGNENLEERVDGVERIDPVVLEELRRQT